MSLELLANVCSHVSNASKARLGITSIPNTKLHLRLALQLQNSGFISTVVRGGPQPPPAHQLLSHPVGYDIEPITRENVASRRLWLGMKYWNSEPVLEKMQMISKPTRRIWMDVEGLRKIVLGQKSGYVEGLTKPGECLYVSTDRGILEARDCVERKLGGMLLCKSHVRAVGIGDRGEITLDGRQRLWQAGNREDISVMPEQVRRRRTLQHMAALREEKVFRPGT